MIRIRPVSSRSLRLLWASTLVLTGLAFLQHAFLLARSQPISPNRMTALGVMVLALLAFGVALATVRGFENRVLRWLELGHARLHRHRAAAAITFVVAICLFLLLVFGPLERWFELYSSRLLLFWLIVLAASVTLSAAFNERGLGQWLAFTGVTTAAIYLAATYLPAISTYPFTMGWSEASRYYFASLFFSDRIFGVHLPWPVLHPSRYLLQSIPFAFGDLPLWFHRLWQVLLWLGMTLAGAFALQRRVHLQDALRRAIFVLWAFLFLFQGPVYYHLIPCALIVLLGFDIRRPWRTLLLVVSASLWAGISRINWVPVPAFLAATLYLLESAPGEVRLRPLGYWWWPGLWIVLGGLSGLAANAGYVVLSGNPPQEFSSSFTSDLLWYRWLPNATFPIGILPGILFVSGPLLIGLLLHARELERTFGRLRMAAVFAMLLVLFLGGAVVSTKIGGGGNLHNLDAYLVLLAVIGSEVLLKGVATTDPPQGVRPLRAPPWLAGVILCVPVLWSLSLGASFSPRNVRGAEEALEELRSTVSEVVQRGGNVLFMSERHLLTFHMVGDVPLIAEYEKTYLMEMAMSHNEAYLGRFYEDIRQKRFDLVVAEPMTVVYYGSGHVFGEEDDTWVRAISEPFLQQYQPMLMLDEFGIRVYSPK